MSTLLSSKFSPDINLLTCVFLSHGYDLLLVESSHEGLRGFRSFMDTYKRTIYADLSLTRPQLVECLFHELGHVLLVETSLAAALDEIGNELAATALGRLVKSQIHALAANDFQEVCHG
jgi:hypothetical protein